jgi:putative SOS response-associated peptidase YedK
VIVDDHAHDAWLMPGTSPVALGALLSPDPHDDFDAHAVSQYVNAPTHDDARCWEPVSESS